MMKKLNPRNAFIVYTIIVAFPGCLLTNVSRIFSLSSESSNIILGYLLAILPSIVIAILIRTIKYESKTPLLKGIRLNLLVLANAIFSLLFYSTTQNLYIYLNSSLEYYSGNSQLFVLHLLVSIFCGYLLGIIFLFD